jgi:uncharacterized membrane protein
MLSGLLLLGAGAYVRGTYTREPRDPEIAGEGPTCAVCAAPGGGKEVRCAIRLAHPMDEVWKVVTDYDHFGDICPYLDAEAIRHDPAGTSRIEARAQSGLPGTIPFAVEMHYEQGLHQYTASWDQPDGNVLVNRGAWTLRPVGPSETLLILTLEVQMKNIPTFILRNISLHRLPRVVLAVEKRLREGTPGEPW